MKQLMILLRFILGFLLGMLLEGQASSLYAQWDLSKMVTISGGEVIYHPKPVPAELLNPWPAELEREFQQRAHAVIAAQSRDTKPSVNTYFENEKRSYGFLMAHVLGGNREVALKHLQAQDHQHEQWHAETKGVDYFACFTLKHQMRKYFYFGDLLEPEYRQTMFVGAKRWTEIDPLRRPHYAYEANKSGWGPDARNSWVDVRSTENLWLMRTSSVYLMAEETGNLETAKHYRQQLLEYTKTLYRVGIGEWDSENYLGHSIAPLLNLYDFARDLEVRTAAKACLDFNAAAGALKYWRGGFNGPTKRDYNHAQPFGGSAANSLWIWFGDHPHGKASNWESDEVHQITSAYRPPLAVVNLARKRFQRPVEVFAAKPAYEATTGFESESLPEYSETQYIAHTYQLGSLTGGTSIDGDDVNGFKMLVYDDEQGAVALHAIPGNKPELPGSPMYKQGVVSAPNRVAQHGNLALWLVRDGKSPWMWVVPASVEVDRRDEVTILKCDKTWVAIRPLGATNLEFNQDLTTQLEQNKNSNFAGHKVLSCHGRSQEFCGLLVEVGEPESHVSYDKFVEAVTLAAPETHELDRGRVSYTAANGRSVAIEWHDAPLQLGVWRNGERRDLSNLALYESTILKSAWGSGELTITTDGASFHTTR
ncbi:MAG: hypothetical protein SFV81_10050 [Pirellulaceae bacterium]|nr:hypothetical protein [Pirellulaceae bacterium]